MSNAAVKDVETARKEWARTDGVIIVNPGGEVKADDQSFDFAGWSKLLVDSKQEIEGSDLTRNYSGRAASNSQAALSHSCNRRALQTWARIFRASGLEGARLSCGAERHSAPLDGGALYSRDR